MSMALQSFYSQ